MAVLKSPQLGSCSRDFDQVFFQVQSGLEKVINRSNFCCMPKILSLMTAMFYTDPVEMMKYTDQGDIISMLSSIKICTCLMAPSNRRVQ
jgi:hypothetical protein